MAGHSRLRVRIFLWAAAAVVLLAIPELRAQPTTEDRSAYFGGWTLNRELSSQPPSPEQSRGERGRPGVGTGSGGFERPGRRGGVGTPPLKPELMKTTMDLTQELMTPSAHLVITPAEGGAIRFTEADGVSRKFVANDRREKHQFMNGTAETKTKWDGGKLRQDVFVTERMRLVRTYGVLPESRQLVITMTMDGGLGGGREPIRFVYDADADR